MKKIIKLLFLNWSDNLSINCDLSRTWKFAVDMVIVHADNNLGTAYVALFYWNDFLNWETRNNEIQKGKRAHGVKSKT